MRNRKADIDKGLLSSVITKDKLPAIKSVAILDLSERFSSNRGLWVIHLVVLF